MANFKFDASAQVTAKFSGGLGGLDYRKHPGRTAVIVQAASSSGGFS